LTTAVFIRIGPPLNSANFSSQAIISAFPVRRRQTAQR
jgi:hypothetical protein